MGDVDGGLVHTNDRWRRSQRGCTRRARGSQGALLGGTHGGALRPHSCVVGGAEGVGRNGRRSNLRVVDGTRTPDRLGDFPGFFMTWR
jgi:hypothetical protein